MYPLEISDIYSGSDEYNNLIYIYKQKAVYTIKLCAQKVLWCDDGEIPSCLMLSLPCKWLILTELRDAIYMYLCTDELDAIYRSACKVCWVYIAIVILYIYKWP